MIITVVTVCCLQAQWGSALSLKQGTTKWQPTKSCRTSAGGFLGLIFGHEVYLSCLKIGRSAVHGDGAIRIHCTFKQELINFPLRNWQLCVKILATPLRLIGSFPLQCKILQTRNGMQHLATCAQYKHADLQETVNTWRRYCITIKNKGKRLMSKSLAITARWTLVVYCYSTLVYCLVL